MSQGKIGKPSPNIRIKGDAKIVSESIQKYNKMAIKAGLAEGKFASKDEVIALSKIPSREVLIGQLLGMLTSPMRSLAVVLSEHAKQLG